MEFSGVFPPADGPGSPRISGQFPTQSRRRGIGRTACSRCKTRKQKVCRLHYMSGDTKALSILIIQFGSVMVACPSVPTVRNQGPLATCKMSVVRTWSSQSAFIHTFFIGQSNEYLGTFMPLKIRSLNWKSNFNCINIRRLKSPMPGSRRGTHRGRWALPT